MSSSTIRVVAPLLTLGLIGAAAVVFLRPLSNAQSKIKDSAQSPTERTVANKVPNQVPLKIEFKKDKEALVKALRNDKWLEDFQLEITNTSKKPIYYFQIYVVLPDVLGSNGNPIGFPIKYGRLEFIDLNTRPTKEDVPMEAKQTLTFQIPQKYVPIWEDLRTRRNYAQPNKLQLEFVHLSFGDGSGFDGTGKPFPYERISNACLVEPESTTNTFSSVVIPVFSPVFFYSVLTHHLT